jgi:ubiquitin carboxyl-terminal hydrolase 36/42
MLSSIFIAGRAQKLISAAQKAQKTPPTLTTFSRKKRPRDRAEDTPTLPHTTPAALQSFATPSPINAKESENQNQKQKENQEVNVLPLSKRFRLSGPSRRLSLDRGLFRNPTKTSRPPTGLLNLGNTCYLNAILQSFFAMEPFCSFLEEVAQKADNQQQGGEGLLAGMRECLVSKNRRSNNPFAAVLAPQPVLMALKRQFPSFFVDNLQQDAHEVFCRLIECIELELLKLSTRGFSMFNFTMVHTFRCCSCGETSSSEELANHISLSLPSADQSHIPKAKVSLEWLLNGYLSTEDIQKDCEKCMKQHTLHSLEHAFKNLPNILVLHIKRFTTACWKSLEEAIGESDDTVKWTKARDKVGLPQSMTLVPSSNGGGKATQYRLVAAINHHGHTMEHGHYTADVVCGDNEWYRCNDGRVSAKSLLDPEAAYMAFYDSKGQGLVVEQGPPSSIPQ